MDKIEKISQAKCWCLRKNLNNKNADGDRYDPCIFLFAHTNAWRTVLDRKIE